MTDGTPSATHRTVTANNITLLPRKILRKRLHQAQPLRKTRRLRRLVRVVDGQQEHEPGSPASHSICCVQRRLGHLRVCARRRIEARV